MALHAKAKGSKYVREAWQESGFRLRGTKRSKPNLKGGTSGTQPAATATAAAPQPWSYTSQPFLGGPPPAAKRGGQGGKAKIYVFFISGTGSATNFRFESDRPSHRPSRGQVSTASGELEKVTSDKWVLQAVNGCLIEWLETPHQIREPFTPRFSKAECQSLTVAGEKMLQKDRKFIRGDSPVCGTFVPEAKERWVTAARVRSETS